MTALKYKGYTGTVKFNHNDEVYYGEVDCDFQIKYKGDSLLELEGDFIREIENHLLVCELHDEPRAKPCSETINP